MYVLLNNLFVKNTDYSCIVEEEHEICIIKFFVYCLLVNILYKEKQLGCLVLNFHICTFCHLREACWPLSLMK